MGLVSGLQSNPVSGLQSGLNPGGVVVPSDGGIFFPATAADWVALSLPAPTAIWLPQNTSGNISDEIGSATLVANGSVSYDQDTADFTRNGVGFDELSNNQRFQLSDGSLDVDLDVSFAMYIVIDPLAVPSTDRQIMFWGPGNNWLALRSTGAPRVRLNGSLNTSAVNHIDGNAHPFLVVRNVTGTSANLYTDLETLALTYSNADLGTSATGIGASNGLRTPSHVNVYAAFWLGAAAESLNAATLTTLGW